MSDRIYATLHGVHGQSMSAREATHYLELTGNRQVMWELFWVLAAELQQDATFHSRDPKAMDLSLGLYVEVTSGID